MRKRIQISMSVPVAIAVPSVNAPNASIEPTSTALRPIRSAIHPPSAAPMNRPIVLLLNTQPSCAGLNPNSGAKRGAVTPAALEVIAFDQRGDEAEQEGRGIAARSGIVGHGSLPSAPLRGGQSLRNPIPRSPECHVPNRGISGIL